MVISMRERRFLLLLILILLSVIYFSKEQFFKNAKPMVKTDFSGGQIADPKTEQVQSFSISGFSESGEKTWEVKGRTADILTETINLSDIKGNSYGDEVKVNLKADEGVFDKGSNNLELKKNVVAVTDEGTKLTTQRLNWNAEKELINTDEYVLIEREDMDLEGIGGSAKPDLRTAQLDKEVKLKLKDRSTVITCDGPLEVDYNKNISYFYNNVKLDDGKTQIYSDKSTAYFDPKQRVVTRVFCEGNVKILRGEDVTYAEELTYLPDEGKVVLTGRPKIIIHSTDELMEETKEENQGREAEIKKEKGESQ